MNYRVVVIVVWLVKLSKTCTWVSPYESMYRLFDCDWHLSDPRRMGSPLLIVFVCRLGPEVDQSGQEVWVVKHLVVVQNLWPHPVWMKVHLVAVTSLSSPSQLTSVDTQSATNDSASNTIFSDTRPNTTEDSRWGRVRQTVLVQQLRRCPMTVLDTAENLSSSSQPTSVDIRSVTNDSASNTICWDIRRSTMVDSHWGHPRWLVAVEHLVNNFLLQRDISFHFKFTVW